MTTEVGRVPIGRPLSTTIMGHDRIFRIIDTVGGTLTRAGVAMLAAVVVLHLLVYDTETGAVLYSTTRAMPSFVNSIENCRKEGVNKAQRLAAEYLKTYPAASANVDCEWRRGIPTDPA